MNDEEIQHAIEHAESVFMKLFADGDARGLAALYTADGQIIPDDCDPISGRESIAGMFGELLKDRPRIDLHTREVQGFGDTAYEVGTFTLVGECVEQGNYIVIWRREDERWMLHRDIFNVKARSVKLTTGKAKVPEDRQ